MADVARGMMPWTTPPWEAGTLCMAKAVKPGSVSKRVAELPSAMKVPAGLSKKVPAGVKKIASVLPESAPLIGKVAKKRRGPKLLRRLGLATAAVAAAADITRRVRARSETGASCVFPNRLSYCER